MTYQVTHVVTRFIGGTRCGGQRKARLYQVVDVTGMMLGAGGFHQHWDVSRARRMKDMFGVDGSGLSAVKALREAVLELSP